MKTITLILFCCAIFTAKLSAQTAKHDTLLIQKIDSMFKDDQFWRKEYTKVVKKQPSQYDQETIEKKWAEGDSINEVKAKAIISKYGYPGYSLAGEKSDTFFWIIQHCDDDIPFQEKVLSLLKIEITKNNASKRNYAYLTDRVLMNKKQKQIYGTQIYTDPKTHKSSPWKLKYPKQVNALRKKMGMETEEAYLKTFQ
jgi:cell division protein FtsL